MFEKKLTPAQKRIKTLEKKYGKDWAKVQGQKTQQTIKQKYGEDYYAKIGSKGGTKSRGGGFAYDRELAVRAGRKGGLNSRRGKTNEEN